MSIIARYLGPVLVVAAARINAKTAKKSGQTIWKNRSPVRSACHEFKKVVITAKTYGGAVRRSESTLLYFSVATTVLKTCQ